MRDKIHKIIMEYMSDGEEMTPTDKMLLAINKRICALIDADCISRQMAIQKMRDLYSEDLEAYGVEIPEMFDSDRAIEALQNLPSAEAERKKGKWIRITQGAMPEQYICPFCHRIVEAYGVEELLKIQYPYCHCGADMRPKWMRGEEDGQQFDKAK